ncbi:HD domain-containing protein [unidentified bacterial endosymbiont]|uniref:HD domain-containing protein n=1 Tax=unidentified bacterial endosymbiont TaxID=2355 RepID=UPI00209F3B2D|nr:HD domain-containing protein [unidentified bacterial endosymbiont]
MDFEKNLTRKILDPIHGIIRVTNLEMAVIDHPLFQRLRNIKQNSFLYKIFPSAVHSRFEHSLGVLHLSYEIIENLRLNAIRYHNKYQDGHVFCNISEIPPQNIQELRLAALLHDVGHGPMSHQFESFMPTKKELREFFGNKYSEVFDLISNDNDPVEHEHISLIFASIILSDIRNDIIVDIDPDNVLKIIEKKYSDQKITCQIQGHEVDILPLLTSIISSCPIDADRMDYLLRDSYFSGVKSGIYDYNRLFMSIVPVESEAKLFLAYKESGIDCVVEFIGARSSLFSQIYFHKTNRSISSMLNIICNNMQSGSQPNLIIDDLKNQKASNQNAEHLLSDFYLDCSDDHFLNEKLGQWIEKTNTTSSNEKILDDIIKRRPWSKVYEKKYYASNVTITDTASKETIQKIKKHLTDLINKFIKENEFAIDIQTDVAFKDINKTEVKLLVKNLNNSYDAKNLEECGHKLNQYQTINYIFRVFIDRDAANFTLLKTSLPSNINSILEEHLIKK